MRGQQSLFQNLFMQESVRTSSKQRPRNFYLPERNEAMIARYYFHAEHNRYRYDDCLSLLEQEFYITSPRIVNVLSDHSARLNDLIASNPTIKELEKKWPHFNWKVR